MTVRANPAPNPPGAVRSFLLRVTPTPAGPRFLVQDLRTGERREFDSAEALGRHVAGQTQPRLR